MLDVNRIKFLKGMSLHSLFKWDLIHKLSILFLCIQVIGNDRPVNNRVKLYWNYIFEIALMNAHIKYRKLALLLPLESAHVRHPQLKLKLFIIFVKQTQVAYISLLIQRLGEHWNASQRPDKILLASKVIISKVLIRKNRNCRSL